MNKKSSTSDRNQTIENKNTIIENILSLGREESRYAALFRNHVAHMLDIYSTDLECLDYLQSHGPVPVGELSAMRGLSSGAMTSVVDRLEKSGLVRRDHDKVDRRKVIIYPIPDAVNSCLDYYQPYTNNIKKILLKFSESDLEAITSYYKNLIAIDKAEIEKVKDLFSQKKK